MIDDLLLLSGNDIPFPEAQISIHQPTLNEIAYITESSFHYGARSLTFSKESLSEEDKNGLVDKHDFEIFMSMMNDKNFLKFRNESLLVLTLLFPTHRIEVKSRAILLIDSDDNKTAINFNNFELFKENLQQIFCLNGIDNKQDYNPADARAAKIAEKLRKAKAKVAKKKGKNIDKIAFYSNIASVLAIGTQYNLNDIMNYTVYQLLDQYNRYMKKTNSDICIQAKMAGATGLDEVDNWMDDIHS